MDKVKVFITYSWGDTTHTNKVEGLTEHLRLSGYEAVMDVLLSQNETAIDFSKMMHKAMTDYPKVIIVLSDGYKQKAEDFKGGVGKEYSMIIKDINDNPSKYILVSFDGIKDEIYPLELKNRDTIDLTNQAGYHSLHHKLRDVPPREFSAVAASMPNLTPRKINPIFPEISSSLEFASLSDTLVSSGQFAQKYTDLTKSFEIKVKNLGAATNDFSVEVSIPNIHTEDSPHFSIDSGRKIFTFSPSKKIFTGQFFTTDPIQIKVFERDMLKLENESILIKIYTDQGVIEECLPMSALIYEPGNKGKPLTADDFGRRY